MATKEDLQRLREFQKELDDFGSFLIARQEELNYEDKYGFSPFEKVLYEATVLGEENFSGSLDLLICNYEAELNS